MTRRKVSWAMMRREMVDGRGLSHVGEASRDLRDEKGPAIWEKTL